MKKLFFTTILFAAILMACDNQTKVEVSDLRCEGLENPLGIDVRPHLSWIILSGENGVMQTGYRIIVASSLQKVLDGDADLWDSGSVSSSQSANISYEGKIAPRTDFYWKVQVATNKGKSAWSEPALWSSGLSSSEWKAQWIGLEKTSPDDVLIGKTRLAARYLRKDFAVEDKPVESAILYISGLGLYEVSLNGERLGRQVLAPTPTDYSKSVKYNTFDVKHILYADSNTIGVTLGNGRFFSMRAGKDNPGIPEIRNFGLPRLIAQLEIKYSDGSMQTIATDTSWKVTANGPIRANNEFDGEEYDARMEMPGWDLAGFDDSAWDNAEAVTAPGGTLEGQINRNIVPMETITPISIKERAPNIYVLDMGQNMVGRIAMTVSGKRGHTVSLLFSELLNGDGSLYLDNIRGALVNDRYTLKGEEYEEWEPAFTYHGFRYVEITNYPGVPDINNFTGIVLYDEMDLTGEFETSDSTLNQIYKNAVWGIKGNYRGMPTDCPQRDERMGWLGDRATGSRGESFIFNNHNLYAKWLDDIEQAQRESGSIPDVAPNYWSLYNDNMTWPGAYVIIANMLYEQYGSVEPIFRHYDSMVKWINYMKGRFLQDGLLAKDTYGDWCMPPESLELIHSADPARKTDGTLLGTSFYYHILTLLERFATLQGKTDDARQFAADAEATKQAFNSRFLNPDGSYANNTVTANLLPLCFGMTPDESKSAVFKHIVDKTTGEFNTHVSTGLIGIQWLMRGLTMNGRADIALQIATNRSYPSWGYMIDNGATTIWELWNGNTANPAMNSGNHVMLLGDFLIWLYEDLAGIRNQPGSAGFSRIEMKPAFIFGLDHVTASYNSIHGRISSKWMRLPTMIEWTIEIPCNTIATVHFPVDKGGIKMRNGDNPTSLSSIRFIEEKDGSSIYEVGSGEYRFVIEN
jgi:alpha-L-rhamnosidase